MRFDLRFMNIARFLYMVVVALCIICGVFFCSVAKATSETHEPSEAFDPLADVQENHEEGDANSTDITGSEFYKKDNAKLFRDIAISVCTFTMGYFAITIQIKPAIDKYGHSYQQESHLHLLANEKLIKTLMRKQKQKATMLTAFRLPWWVFLPFFSFFVVTIATFALYELYVYYNAIGLFWTLFGISVVAIIVSLGYVRYILNMLYSCRWLGKKMDDIIKKAGDCLNSVSNRPNRDALSTQCIRIVTSSLYSLNDCNVANPNYTQKLLCSLVERNVTTKSLFSNALINPGKDYKTIYEPQLSCLVQLLKAHCIQSFSTSESICELLKTIMKLQGEEGRAYGCFIVGIVAIMELNATIKLINNDEAKDPDLRLKAYHIRKNKEEVYHWLCKSNYGQSTTKQAYKMFVDKTVNESTISPYTEIRHYLLTRENELPLSEG